MAAADCSHASLYLLQSSAARFKGLATWLGGCLCSLPLGWLSDVHCTAVSPGFVAASLNDTYLTVEFHHVASQGSPAFTVAIPKE